MARCIVKNCKYNKTANCRRGKDAVHLFRFPKNHDRREVWRIALNLQRDDIFETSTVCHLHFGVKLFDHEKSPFRLHLKQDAVPSVGARKMGQLNAISSPKPSTTSVFFINCPVLPSTSSAFHKENVISELSPRSFTSLGFVENKTPPSSPLRKSSMDNDTNEDPIKLECASTSGDNTMLTFECASTSGDNTMFQDNVESPTVIKKEEDVEFSEYESEANGSLSRENESNRGPAHGIGQDEYDAIGYNVASKLRHMEEGQRIIAEIIIAETLFRGQMGTLRVGDNCSTLCPTLPLKVEVEDIKFNPPVDDK